MSKHWTYEVWLSASQILTPVQVRRVLELAEQHGYVPRRINRILPSYDLEENRVQSIDAAVDTLCRVGGLLRLGRTSAQEWDTAIDIAMPEAPSSRPSRSNSSPGPADPASNRAYFELTIYVGDYMYRSENESPDRIEHATDVWDLFCDLCTYFDAQYGAAWSNYDYEEIIGALHDALYGPVELSADTSRDKQTFLDLIDGKRLDTEVRSGQPPGVLFWIQYFSLAYAERLDLEALAALGGKVQPLPKGVLLSFFDQPWEVDLLQLLEINQKWRKLNPTWRSTSS